MSNYPVRRTRGDAFNYTAREDPAVVPPRQPPRGQQQGGQRQYLADAEQPRKYQAQGRQQQQASPRQVQYHRGGGDEAAARGGHDRGNRSSRYGASSEPDAASQREQDGHYHSSSHVPVLQSAPLTFSSKYSSGRRNASSEAYHGTAATSTARTSPYSRDQSAEHSSFDYARAPVPSNAPKASKYGAKSSTAAMNQYTSPPHQEKSMNNLQEMRGQPSPSGQYTRDQRRAHPVHSSAKAYRNLSDATSNLSLSHPDDDADDASAKSSHTRQSGASSLVSSLNDTDVNDGASDFITWAMLQDPHDISDSLLRDPSAMSRMDSDYNSLLHSSAEVGNLSMVNFLLSKLPAKQAKNLLRSYNKDGLEPFHLATKNSMIHILQKLVKFDAKLPQRTTEDGSTALHVAVMANASNAVIKYLVSILDKKHVWATNATGSTPLHLACIEGNVTLMNALLEVEGVDVNRPDGQGRSCLHISIILGHFLMTKALLALEHPFKPAIEQTGQQNNTSLHYACSNHQYSLIKLLLEHGANVNAKNKMKMTPSDLGNDDIIDLLFENKAKYLPKVVTFPFAKINAEDSDDSDEEGEEEEEDSDEEGEEDNKEEEDEDDEEDEDVEDEDGEDEDDEDGEDEDEAKVKSDGDLFESVKMGCIPDLEKVIGSHDGLKRNVNKIRDLESKGTLLHAACKHGHLDVAQYLVEGAGAAVDLQDEYGMTPLHYAVEAEQLLLVRYLVKYCGAKLDIKDNAGNVALDLADEDDAEDDENLEEISRIIQKSLNKPPFKRKLVKSPVISKALK